MIELLKHQDQERFKCCMLETQDFEDNSGLEIARQHLRLIAHEQSLSDEDYATRLERLKASIAKGRADIIVWDPEKKEVAGNLLIMPSRDNPETAKFLSIYTKQSYRRQGLSDILYAGGLHYIHEEGFEGATSNIREKNTASIKAAERNGFVHVGYVEEEEDMSEFLGRIRKYAFRFDDQGPKPGPKETLDGGEP